MTSLLRPAVDNKIRKTRIIFAKYDKYQEKNKQKNRKIYNHTTTTTKQLLVLYIK